MFLYSHQASKSFYLTESEESRNVLLSVVKKPTRGSCPMRHIIFEHVRKHNIPPFMQGYDNLARPITRHRSSVFTKAVVEEWKAAWDIEALQFSGKENLEEFIEQKTADGWLCMNIRLQKINFLALYDKYHGNKSTDSSST